jgi:hypothetical protein
MEVLKTISLITSVLAPKDSPVNTVPSSRIKYAFIISSKSYFANYATFDKRKRKNKSLVSLFLLLSIYAQIVRIVAHKSKLFKYKIQINSPDFYYLSL